MVKKFKKQYILPWFHFLNLKQQGLLKGGELLYIWFFLPSIFGQKKTSFIFNLQIKPDFRNAQKCLKYFVYKRKKLQTFLKQQVESTWILRAFSGRVVYNRLTLQTRKVVLGYKLKKVFVKGFFHLGATNVVSCFNIKNSSKNFRHKSLQYLLERLKKKMHRLYPIRKMHRKKRSR